MVGGECIDDRLVCCVRVAECSRRIGKGRRQVLCASSTTGTEHENQRTNLETLCDPF
jgi:hypothetical protein